MKYRDERDYSSTLNNSRKNVNYVSSICFLNITLIDKNDDQIKTLLNISLYMKDKCCFLQFYWCVKVLTEAYFVRRAEAIHSKSVRKINTIKPKISQKKHSILIIIYL